MTGVSLDHVFPSAEDSTMSTGEYPLVMEQSQSPLWESVSTRRQSVFVSAATQPFKAPPAAAPAASGGALPDDGHRFGVLVRRADHEEARLVFPQLPGVFARALHVSPRAGVPSEAS